MGVALGLAFGTELRAAPAVLRVDNGPEFMSEQLLRNGPFSMSREVVVIAKIHELPFRGAVVIEQ